MTADVGPYRGGDGFARLVRAEWTKFRTVRGWVAGMIIAGLATAGFGVLLASATYCSGPSGQACSAWLGPGGVPVTDQFYFVRRPLTGNGSITVRVTSLTGGLGGSGLQPWSKAGIIIKASTRPGSAYAAMMVTGGHGTRMQYDYTGDAAGLTGAVSAASPRWLRLTRSGAVLTGYDSVNGTRWTEVGTATLTGLAATVQAGLFATAPGAGQESQTLATSTGIAVATAATATLDHVDLTRSGGTWTGTDVGAGARPTERGGFRQAGGTFKVSGSGDIAPSVSPLGVGTPVGHVLVGAFAGLIAVIVVGAMFVTAEYRNGLIRTTFTASPRRSRLLAAKAIVIGSVAFGTGLTGAAVAIPVGVRTLRRHGNFIDPVSTLTELRVMTGTAAVLALASVLALGLGAVLRHGTAAVATAIAGIVLPYLLAVATPALPVGAADWLLRVTPAAAFAVQQTSPQYQQVSNSYMPFFGYYPLAPWAGFAVLCGYTAVVLAVAAFLLRRRDA